MADGNSFILPILRPFSRITVASVAQPTWTTIEIGAGLSWADDPTNKRGVLSIGTAPSLTGPVTITGGLTVDSLKVGFNDEESKQTTTVGGASSTFCGIPFPVNKFAPIHFEIGATDGVYLYGSESGTGTFFASGGTPTLHPQSPVNYNTFPLPVSANVTYSAATLSLTVGGASAAITAAADNGGGHVRLTTSGLTSWAGTISLDISGLGVCTEANGTHAATYVSATLMDLLAVSVVHTGVDTGTAILHGSTITWTAKMDATIGP